MTRAQLAHLKADEPTATLLDVLHEDGAVVVEGMLDRTAIDQISADLQDDADNADPEMEHLNPGVQAFYRGTRNVTGLAGKSPTFVNAVLLQPTLLDVAEAVLAPNCSDISLNLAHLLVRDPGAPEQVLHRDEDVWAHLMRLLRAHDAETQVQVSSVTALRDFTAHNGATRLVPGSHRWDRDRRAEPHEVAVAEMPAGSTVVYLGSAMHGGGPNTSDHPRYGFHVSYVVGWLRTEENNVLATPPALARNMPRRAQELVGYGYHDAIDIAGGYVGHVDLRNPVDLLATDEL